MLTRTGKGNRWLKAALVQAAWAASRSKKTYVAARFRRLAARRGHKRALVATGHSLLKLIYQVLKEGKSFRELDAMGRRRPLPVSSVEENHHKPSKGANHVSGPSAVYEVRPGSVLGL